MPTGKNTVKHSKKIRTFIILTIVIVLIALTLGGIYYWRKSSILQSNASLSKGPDIESIPGAGNPSAEYVKKQNTANAIGAKQAKEKGTSAIPTLTRSNFQGDLSLFDSSGGNPKNCAIIASGGKIVSHPEDCSISNLEKARQAGVQAEELRCLGCACPVLKEVGYTAGELKNAGFSAKDLHDCGFSAKALKAAGFSAKELKAAGFSAKALKDAGFSAAEMKAAGFSDKQLQDAAFSPSAIKALNQKNTKKTCSKERLKKAREQGISATQLRQEGCGLAALKAAGYTAAELKNAGFTAKQLKDAGFSAKQLKDAGFSAKALKDAGFSAGDLKDAGFSAKQLKDAGFDAKALRDAGFSAADLKKAGFSPSELMKAGFSKGDLVRAGFSPSEAGLNTAVPKDCSVAELKKARENGFSARYLKKKGCPPAALRAAGFNRDELKGAGFSSPGGSRLSSIHSGLSSSAQIPSIGGGSSVEQQLALARQQQARMLAQQKRDNMVRQLQSQMGAQAQQLLSAWGSSPTQQVEVTMLKGQTQGQGSGTSAGKNKATGPVIKAGSILFAVLDTGINSDEKSPILASIIAGPLKGSKVLGSFNRVDKRVVLSFSTLSIPSMTNSISVNAVAIDANTAHTALADNVDNHYLLRYGTLFASSFLSGLGSAIDQSGATVITGIFGQNTIQKDKLNTAQTFASALGNVGQEFGNATSSYFDTPPTVKIDAGAGIGLLFMQDLTLPEGAIQTDNTTN